MKLIFTITILEVAGVIGYQLLPRLGSNSVVGGHVPAMLLLAVFLVTFAAAWYIVLSGRYPPAVVNWACGLIGSIIGFCLKALT